MSEIYFPNQYNFRKDKDGLIITQLRIGYCDIVPFHGACL